MTPDLSTHQRRSIRLKGYDYTQPGAYFVTICTDQRALLFGDVNSGQMRCNPYGKIAHEEWWAAERKRTGVQLDASVVMPNHVHGIVRILPGTPGTARRALTDLPRSFGQAVAGSLCTWVGAFKSAVARPINKVRGTPEKAVWQRGYFEHVVRNEVELARIREYIFANPERWPSDPENPSAIAADGEPELWDL